MGGDLPTTTGDTPHLTTILQAVLFASSAVVNNSLLVLGGMTADRQLLATTQLVRPGQPTVQGPDMTEGKVFHCSATLEDGSVIVAGGMTESNPYGSTLTEVYNATTLQWERRGGMQHGRLDHACASVWLDPHPAVDDGIIARYVDSQSVLSVIAAGGGMVLHYTTNTLLQESTLMRKESYTTSPA